MSDDADDADDVGDEVPEGAAVFPHIPAELLVDPVLLAAVHAVVFFLGSEEEVVHPAAADEALDRMAGYLQRLEGERLRAVTEDMRCVVSYARQEKWPKALVEALRNLLSELGVGGGGEDETEGDE